MTLEFKSWQSFRHFTAAVKLRARHVRDPETEEFLSTVLATAKDREQKIVAGRVFWRAQLGYDSSFIHQDDEYYNYGPHPFPPKRMKPLPNRASEGRANPKGIPCLYLATHSETAIAEVRPWLGSLVSVAQFKIMRDLIIVDCGVSDEDPMMKRPLIVAPASDDGFTIDFEEPEPAERTQAVWADIDRAFSQPVAPSDQLADYVPTQILAELFKSRGYDGIVYRSAFGAGRNLALFDLDAAEILNCILFKVTSVKLESKQASNPYFIKKHYHDDPKPHGT